MGGRRHRNYHSKSDQDNLEAHLKGLQAMVTDFDDITTQMQQQMDQLLALQDRHKDDNELKAKLEPVYLKLGRGFRKAKELADHLIVSQVVFFNEWNRSLCRKVKSARDVLAD